MLCIAGPSATSSASFALGQWREVSAVYSVPREATGFPAAAFSKGATARVQSLLAFVETKTTLLLILLLIRACPAFYPVRLFFCDVNVQPSQQGFQGLGMFGFAFFAVLASRLSSIPFRRSPRARLPIWPSLRHLESRGCCGCCGCWEFQSIAPRDAPRAPRFHCSWRAFGADLCSCFNDINRQSTSLILILHV